ncbi:hypothetical protein NLM24_32855 [Nocardia zapadnayensis]|uniref:hypothetical protein n=1 Tax=Nocardia rhamnosiphila TaxID=426716 RepID=UPI00224585E2|nr:hypothetical protein [Nocardia zapadnayensis]
MHFGLEHPGIRAAIVVAVDRIADSCGYAVPNYEFVGERPVLDAHHARQPDEKYARRITGDNGHSIDGLPALDLDHPLPSEVRR